MFVENLELFSNYTAILREELVPAMGCTEPIAIAYAAAKAKELRSTSRWTAPATSSKT